MKIYTVKDYFYNSSNDTGYAFKLKSNYNVATEGRRPYIKGVSVITKGSVTSASDPRGFNQGDAGRGALIDGSVVSHHLQKQLYYSMSVHL